MRIVRNLQFTEQPPYEMLRKLFVDYRTKHCDGNVDWMSTLRRREKPLADDTNDVPLCKAGGVEAPPPALPAPAAAPLAPAEEARPAKKARPEPEVIVISDSDDNHGHHHELEEPLPTPLPTNEVRFRGL